MEGEALYRSMADRTQSATLRRILILLAEEEVKHRGLLQAISTHQSLPDWPEPQKQQAWQESQRLYSNLTQHMDILIEQSEQSFFEQAIKAEEASDLFYRKLASQSTHADEKRLLLRLSEEEQLHQALLQGILQLLNTPQTQGKQ